MSITDFQPPPVREIPRAASDRMRHELRTAIGVGTISGQRWRAPTCRVVAIGAAVLVALTFAALASTGTLRRTLGVLGPGTKSPTEVAVDIRSDWTRSLTEGAFDDPTASFPNPSAEQLRARLAAAASEYAFRVRNVAILRPRQDAPAIVIQSDTPRTLIAQVPAILQMLDPKAPGQDNEGWSYEGFFLEIVDSGDSPVMIVANTWRSPDAGGTQWVAPGYDLPYDHL
jgi:hypothetical protein